VLKGDIITNLWIQTPKNLLKFYLIPMHHYFLVDNIFFVLNDTINTVRRMTALKLKK